MIRLNLSLKTAATAYLAAALTVSTTTASPLVANKVDPAEFAAAEEAYLDAYSPIAFENQWDIKSLEESFANIDWNAPVESFFPKHHHRHHDHADKQGHEFEEYLRNEDDEDDEDIDFDTHVAMRAHSEHAQQHASDEIFHNINLDTPNTAAKNIFPVSNSNNNNEDDTDEDRYSSEDSDAELDIRLLPQIPQTAFNPLPGEMSFDSTISDESDEVDEDNNNNTNGDDGEDNGEGDEENPDDDNPDGEDHKHEDDDEPVKVEEPQQPVKKPTMWNRIVDSVKNLWPFKKWQKPSVPENDETESEDVPVSHKNSSSTAPVNQPSTKPKQGATTAPKPVHHRLSGTHADRTDIMLNSISSVLDVKTCPATRARPRGEEPKNIHDLRPSDIKVMMSIGDRYVQLLFTSILNPQTNQDNNHLVS